MAGFGRALKDRVLAIFGAKNTAYTNTIDLGGSSQPTDNKATWNYGFPSKTMLPVDTTNPSAGGIPPNGKDMNGVLNSISAECYNAMNGAMANEWISPNVWKSVDSSWSGYSAGAIVLYPAGNTATKKEFYQSVANNNLDTPSQSDKWVKVTTFINPFGVFPNYSNGFAIKNNEWNSYYAVENFNYQLPNHWGWVWASTSRCVWDASKITINGSEFIIGSYSEDDEGSGTGSFFLPVPPKSIINSYKNLGTIRFYYSYDNWQTGFNF